MEIIKEQISAILGKDNFICGTENLAVYAKDNISFIPERYPLMAVRPGTVEELKEVLKVASLNKVPVTPFSSECNGHGGSIPSVPGITIDLRRLNRIHLIDPLCRNAIIEPGVTFAQLQQQAKEKGLRALSALELPSNASVISTYVDMAPLYSWPRYGTESILTMEVLMPNGEILKTGIAAIPMIDKPYFPFGTNPSYLNKIWFASQGTLGIVTKAVVKLKTDFETKEILFIPFNAFPESFNVLREIKRFDYPVEFFLADSAYLAGLISDNHEDFLKAKNSLPPVTAVIVLRGEKEEVEYQKEDIKKLSQKMNFKILETLPVECDVTKKILDEIEMPQGYLKFKKIKGAYSVIPFICMTAQIPMFERIMAQILQTFKYDRKDIGTLLLPAEASRVHYQYSFYFNPENPQEHMIVKKLFETLSSTLIKMGAFFSRPYGEWADLVYAKAGAYKSMLKTIKKAIDPENIMNPGKLNL